MKQQEKGGAAFPSNFMLPENQGMTLRDYFAAKAMQGLVAGQGSFDGSWDMDAEAAYIIADAMLEARK